MTLKTCTHTICLVLVLATLINGLPYWFKRVGLLESHYYKTYQKEWAAKPDHLRTYEEKLEFRQFAVKLHSHPGWQGVCKIFKDVAVVCILALLVWVYSLKQGVFLNLHPALMVLGGVLGVSGIEAWIRFGPMVPMLGVRSCYTLLAAVLGGWLLTEKFALITAKYLYGFCVAQMLLAPYEFFHGMHLYTARFLGGDIGDRIVGTMIMPISLGTMAVLCFVFNLVFNKTGRGYLVFLAGIVTLLVFFSASGTAWVLCSATAGFMVVRSVPHRLKSTVKLTGICFTVLMAICLPVVTGRLDIYDSILGRIDELIKIFSKWEDMAVILFGKGLGTASCLLYQYIGFNGTVHISVPKLAPDSTPMALISQTGLIGCMVFYGCMLLSWRKKVNTRPIVLIMALSSLTINILEFFPVNILLGVLMGYCLRVPRIGIDKACP